MCFSPISGVDSPSLVVRGTFDTCMYVYIVHRKMDFPTLLLYIVGGTSVKEDGLPQYCYFAL